MGLSRKNPVYRLPVPEFRNVEIEEFRYRMWLEKQQNVRAAMYAKSRLYCYRRLFTPY